MDFGSFIRIQPGRKKQPQGYKRHSIPIISGNRQNFKILPFCSGPYPTYFHVCIYRHLQIFNILKVSPQFPTNYFSEVKLCFKAYTILDQPRIRELSHFRDLGIDEFVLNQVSNGVKMSSTRYNKCHYILYNIFLLFNTIIPKYNF